jgi:hypothetical protein
MENPQFNDHFLKAAQIAAARNVSKTQAYRLIETELPSVKFSQATIWVRFGDLLRYIENHMDHHIQSLFNAIQSEHELAGK